MLFTKNIARVSLLQVIREVLCLHFFFLNFIFAGAKSWLASSTVVFGFNIPLQLGVYLV